jgi:hypothetical protein
MSLICQIDVFDFNLRNLDTGDSGAAAVTKLIKFDNLSFPQWRYNDLVVNELGPVDLYPSSRPDEESQHVVISIMANRPSFNCAVLPQSVVKIEPHEDSPEELLIFD